MAATLEQKAVCVARNIEWELRQARNITIYKKVQEYDKGRFWMMPNDLDLTPVEKDRWNRIIVGKMLEIAGISGTKVGETYRMVHKNLQIK